MIQINYMEISLTVSGIIEKANISGISLINNTEDVLVTVQSKLDNIDVDLITPDLVTKLVIDIGQVLIDTAKNTFGVSNRSSRNRNDKNNFGLINYARKKHDEFHTTRGKFKATHSMPRKAEMNVKAKAYRQSPK